jgi:putative ABC transport system permease protein
VERLRRDLRFAIRQLRKSPGFAITSLVTLALGLGSATAIFTVVDGVLLQPLPYPHPQRILEISSRYHGGPDYHVIRDAQFRFLQERSVSFESLALNDVVASGVNLSGGSGAEQVTASLVSAQFFQVLSLAPALGRSFMPEDERVGAGCVVILTDGLWRTRYNGERTILTNPITVNGVSCSVVGILPPGFWFQLDAQMFMPLKVAAAPRDLGHYYNLLARLKPGVTVTQATDELATLFPQFKLAHGDLVDDGEVGFQANRYQDVVLGNVRPALWLLFVAVFLLLLISCVNVAHLQISRAASRVREMAVRASLGANRLRLMRQLITESVLLAFAGATLGLLLTYLGVPLLLHLSPSGLPRAREVAINLSVVAFSIFLSVLTVLVFGLIPALSASRIDLNSVLKAVGRQATPGIAGRLVRSLLVGTEVALSLFLLIGAVLLMRSFVNLQHVATGFDPQHVLTFKMSIPAPYSTTARMWELEREVLARLGALPGAEAAASATCLPLEPGPDMPGKVLAQSQSAAFNPAYRPVSPNYFQVLRIPLVRGRSFIDADSPTSLPVAIINASLARQLFPDREPIGQTLELGVGLGAPYADSPRIIVGVVGDVRETSLTTAPSPTVFIPRSQIPDALTPVMNRTLPMSWAVRTRIAPDQLIGAVRRAIFTVDPRLPAANMRTMQQAMSTAVDRQRFTLVLMSIFASLATTMAAVGIFGVVTYQMRQRQRELGIRLALGALPRSLVRTFTIREARPIAAGMLVGLVASVLLAKLIGSLLFETSSTDPVSLAGSVVVLGLLACLFCYLPIRRASQVDPLQILRDE